MQLMSMEHVHGLNQIIEMPMYNILEQDSMTAMKHTHGGKMDTQNHNIKIICIPQKGVALTSALDIYIYIQLKTGVNICSKTIQVAFNWEFFHEAYN